jgi:hypothetical protein
MRANGSFTEIMSLAATQWLSITKTKTACSLHAVDLESKIT